MNWPTHFFDRVVWHQRRTQPDTREINQLVEAIRAAKRPLMIAGGGVLYSKRRPRWLIWLRPLTSQWQKTQRARVRLPGIIHNSLGAIGVTGTISRQQDAAREADLIIGIGTRLQDFTDPAHDCSSTARRRHLIQVNVQPFDATKQHASPVVGDARTVMKRWPPDWTAVRVTGR